MTLTHSCMFGQSFSTQPFGTYASMLNVWFCAMTEDTRSIAGTNAYIVEHGCLTDKLAVYVQFRM